MHDLTQTQPLLQICILLCGLYVKSHVVFYTTTFESAVYRVLTIMYGHANGNGGKHDSADVGESVNEAEGMEIW